jgi:hypothetical protein
MEEKEGKYFKAIKQAKAMLEKGEVEQAEAILEFAAQFTEVASIDVRDIMNKLLAEVSEIQKGQKQTW